MGPLVRNAYTKQQERTAVCTVGTNTFDYKYVATVPILTHGAGKICLKVTSVVVGTVEDAKTSESLEG